MLSQRSGIHPSDIYALQLMDRCHGHPMWFPEGPDNSKEVQIGDVGYISEGSFHAMFNATYPRDDENQNTDLVPSEYQPFQYSTQRTHHKRYLLPGTISSRSVQAKYFAGSGGGELPSVASAKVGYSMSSHVERGASLSISHPATKGMLQYGRQLMKYLRRHHDEWVQFFEKIDYPVNHHNLIMVVGYVKTVDWTLAAGSSEAVAHIANLSAQVGAGAGGAGIDMSLKYYKSLENSVDHRSGPEKRIKDDGLEDGQRMDDQCVFLRYLQLRWRIGPYKVFMQAGAGPDRRSSHRDDDGPGGIRAEAYNDNDDDGSDGFTIPLIDEEPIRTDLDDLLDYILEVCEAADVAIASHDHVDDILLGVDHPTDFAAFLRDVQPPVELSEDGAATLNLTQLLRKRRLWEITSAPPSQAFQTQFLSSEDCGLGKLFFGQTKTDVPIPWPHVLMQEDDDTIVATALSPDGSLAAAARQNAPYVQLWNARTGKLAKMLDTHGGQVAAVAFSPDGSRVVGGAGDNEVLLWDSNGESEESVLLLQGHDASVLAVAFSPDGMMIASGDGDCVVKVWEAVSGNCLHTFRNLQTHVTILAFAGDSLIACAEAFGKIWNMKDGRLAGKFEHEGAIHTLVVSPEGDRIITGSEDNTACVWNSASGVKYAAIADRTSPVCSVAWSPDGKRVVTGSRDGDVVISDSFTGQPLLVLVSESSMTVSSPAVVGWSPTHTVVCSTSEKGNLRLWDTEAENAEGAFIAEYQGHDENVSELFFSPDGDIVTSSEDASIRRWSVDDALVLRRDMVID